MVDRLVDYAMWAIVITVIVCAIVVVVVSSCGSEIDRSATIVPTAYADEALEVTRLYKGGICLEVIRIIDVEQGNVVYVMDGCSSDGLVVVPIEDR